MDTERKTLANEALPASLEVHGDTSGLWIRCKKCSHALCQMGDDWRQASKKTSTEELACPSCEAVLEEEGQ